MKSGKNNSDKRCEQFFSLLKKHTNRLRKDSKIITRKKCFLAWPVRKDLIFLLNFFTPKQIVFIIFFYKSTTVVLDGKKKCKRRKEKGSQSRHALNHDTEESKILIYSGVLQ